MSIRISYRSADIRRPYPGGIIPAKPRLRVLYGGRCHERRTGDACCLKPLLMVQEYNLFQLAKCLLDDLKVAIVMSAVKSSEKGELLSIIGSRLKNYPLLGPRAFRYAINNFIITETERLCSVHLTSAELALLWPDSK